MITNELRVMHHYLDLEQNKVKCKFIKLSDAYNDVRAYNGAYNM